MNCIYIVTIGMVYCLFPATAANSVTRENIYEIYVENNNNNNNVISFGEFHLLNEIEEEDAAPKI